MAGLVLLTLYGPHSPVGANWYSATRGVILALLSPSVLLLDDPFGALDTKVRKELRDWLRGCMTRCT